jgi:hypothetical protein
VAIPHFSHLEIVMNTRNHLFAAIATALTLLLAVPGAATADVTGAQIAAAKTPADHEAIAKAYDADAASAEAKAREHEAMAKTYRSAGGQKAYTNSMVRHCERLVKDYKEAATDYRALAAEHRGMAKDTAK